MAKNDVVLLDGVLDERVTNALPSTKRDEVFEFFAFEQILKDFDPSSDEIESGWVDGRDDGGIDGFFTIVNGHILQDGATFTWPKRNAEIDVYIVNCKHHDTFVQAPLNSLIAAVPAVLDLSILTSSIKDRFGEDLCTARSRLYEAYTRLSSIRPSLRFHFYYASRGETTQIADNIKSRADQIEGITHGLFSDCDVSFTFLGAAELVAAYRRIKSFSFDLHAQEVMTTGPGNYVAIVRLEDYKNLVTDQTGALKRYLFESNVRDYLGENSVNGDIAESLADPSSPEFWWLNNGITVLATGATSAGKILSLHDIQIVNGLQTTESIFRHFQQGSTVSLDKGVLVKVVVSTDSDVRDKIIRATNNQSLVEASSLHATDKLQRDIEEILERNDWYYERRKNYYRNIGKPPAKFVTPLYIAAGYVALLMRNPALAARLKSRMMRTQEGYERIFTPTAPLEGWVAITRILKKTEEHLIVIREKGEVNTERFLASWRNLVGFLAVSMVRGTFNYSVTELTKFDANDIDLSIVQKIWQIIEDQRKDKPRGRDFIRPAFVIACCKEIERLFGVVGIDRIGRQNLEPRVANEGPVVVSEELVQRVHSVLPKQPWKPGIRRIALETLKCTSRELSSAIEILISRGILFRQRNGILYDLNGNAIGFDPDRVDPANVPESDISGTDLVDPRTVKGDRFLDGASIAGPPSQSPKDPNIMPTLGAEK